MRSEIDVQKTRGERAETIKNWIREKSRAHRSSDAKNGIKKITTEFPKETRRERDASGVDYVPSSRGEEPLGVVRRIGRKYCPERKGVNMKGERGGGRCSVRFFRFAEVGRWGRSMPRR